MVISNISVIPVYLTLKTVSAMASGRSARIVTNEDRHHVCIWTMLLIAKL
jgi:hypothetical protein